MFLLIHFFFCWPASRLVLFCVVYGLVNILSVFHIHHRLHFYGHHFHLYFCICFNFNFCFDFFFLGLKEKIFEISCEEQSVHEEIGAYTEEIISNCEILILEDFYQFYTITLLNIMFTKPECQVGLLEYAGFLKAKSVKNKIPVKFNHRINKQLKEKEDNLLNEFLHYAIESDEINLQKNNNQNHVILIQKMYRGVIDRRKIRKLFLSVYSKR